MAKTHKEIYLHNLNRINRLNEKISEFENKKDACEARIKKLILLWIKRNHKEWLEDVMLAGEDPWMDITPQKDKISVRLYKIDWDTFVDKDEMGHYTYHTIKLNELS